MTGTSLTWLDYLVYCHLNQLLNIYIDFELPPSLKHLRGWYLRVDEIGHFVSTKTQTCYKPKRKKVQNAQICSTFKPPIKEYTIQDRAYEVLRRNFIDQFDYFNGLVQNGQDVRTEMRIFLET